MRIAEGDPAADVLTGIVIATALILVFLGLGGCAAGPALRVLGTQEGIASYYSDEFNGRRTSSGEVFNNGELTAAHRTFPFGTRIKVINLSDRSEVVVRVNDRGPVKPERVVDLTRRAADEIGLVRAGLARVRIEVLEWGQGLRTAALGAK
jgi:rare lipoprotein A